MAVYDDDEIKLFDIIPFLSLQLFRICPFHFLSSTRFIPFLSVETWYIKRMSVGVFQINKAERQSRIYVCARSELTAMFLCNGSLNGRSHSHERKDMGP